MSTKAVRAPEPVPQSVTFLLAMPEVNGQTLGCYYKITNEQLVVKHGDQVDFEIMIPPRFNLKPDQVATYITFTGTNSNRFSVDDPIPWPFLESDKDKETGYQIVLKAGSVSKKYTIRQDISRNYEPVSYSYSVVVKVNAEFVQPVATNGVFYEFRQDPEIYVDEC